MFNYFKGGITDKTPSRIVTIEELVKLVKNHPKEERVKRLHTFEYGSQPYKELKITLPSISAHGTFHTRLRNDNLLALNGYLYFDLDAADMTASLEDTRQMLLSQHSDKICFLSRSVGGRGLCFFVRIENASALTPGNFVNVHAYFRNEVFKSYSLDTNALGVARVLFIPYDEQCYYNDVAVTIDSSIVSYQLADKEKNKKIQLVKCINSDINNKHTDVSITGDTFSSVKAVLNKIIKQTEFDYGNKGFVTNVEVTQFFIRNNIRNGQKHKTYCSMIHNLCFLNPAITLEEIQTLLLWINQYCTCNQPLTNKEVMRYSEIVYNEIISTGEVYPRIKFRKVNTDPKLKNRRKLAMSVLGEMRVNNSVQQIQLVADWMKEQGIKPTIVEVAKVLEGRLGIATIKRHWRKVVPSKNRQDEKSFEYKEAA